MCSAVDCYCIYAFILYNFSKINAEDDSKPLSTRGLEGIDMGVAGWELELVTAPSSNTSHLTENRLVCVFYQP